MHAFPFYAFLAFMAFGVVTAIISAAVISYMRGDL